MTTKIAAIANLALHVFRSHSIQSIGRLSSRSPDCIVSKDSSLPKTLSSEVTGTNINNNAMLDVSNDALKQLLVSVGELTLSDVGLDQEKGFDVSSFIAPVVYVHITENEVFSMGMFVLRPGSRIPLHGHPGMFGIIRVMQGGARCQSFTRLSTSRLKDANGPLAMLSAKGAAKWQISDFTVAQPHQDILVTASCKPCLLTPYTGNLHELTAVEGTVVFLDILAPPYDHDLGTRECHFYREVAIPEPCNPIDSFTEETTGDVRGRCLSGAESLVYLVETHQPKDYWCEPAPYLGPSVS